MGGGRPGAHAEATTRSQSPTPPVATTVRHSCSFSSFLRRQEPAQAGTARAHPPPLPHFPNSSLPPFRGEARWGVGSTERAQKQLRAPSPTPPVAPPPPVIPALFRHSCAGRNRAQWNSASWLQTFGGAEAAWRAVGAHTSASDRPHSCLRRNDGRSRNNGEGGARHDQCARSVPPTPHLTSPLKGGRDELGKGGCVARGLRVDGLGRAGSCLRRNDGWEQE